MKILLECTDMGGLQHNADVLIGRAIELLAQPEQSNEPVAWRGVNFTEAEGDWLYRDIEDPFTDSNYRSVGEALYLAPPEREPLSELEIYRLYENAEYLGFLAYKKGIKDAEKAHNIGVNDE